MSQDPVDTALAPGAVFHGRYRIVRCLNAGGMGAVYEAVHLETRRHRALKVMLPSMVSNAEARARFKLEATICADIESEHIVETFDAGIDSESGSPYLVMELLRGEDLATLMERRGPLPAAEVITMLGQAALALDKTHQAGVVHRDLKPENVFVTRREDGATRVKILDFGIAKYVAQSATTAKQTASVGTPLFMAPEQIRGDGNIGAAADNYALAHIAYALLTGAAYWATEAEALDGVYSLLVKVMEGITCSAVVRAAERGVSLPLSFDAWFERATALAPSERHETATLVVATLAECFGLPAPRPSLPADRSATPSSRPRAEVADTVVSSPGLALPAHAARTTMGVTGDAQRAASEAMARSSTRKTVGLAAGVVAVVGLALLSWLGGAEDRPAPEHQASSTPAEAATPIAAPAAVPAPPSGEPGPAAHVETPSAPSTTAAVSASSPASPSPSPGGTQPRMARTASAPPRSPATAAASAAAVAPKPTSLPETMY